MEVWKHFCKIKPSLQLTLVWSWEDKLVVVVDVVILIFWSCLRTILNTQNKGSLVFVSYLSPHLSLILSTLIKLSQNKMRRQIFYRCNLRCQDEICGAAPL